MLKVYLDNCCYNRPFDDLTQMKIHLEAQAVENIIAMHESKILSIYSSIAVDFEISNIPDSLKKQQVQHICHMLGVPKIEYNNSIKNRANHLIESGISDMDALHIAFAEDGNIDYLITTDKPLINAAKRMELGVKVINPVDFVMEVD